MHALDDTIAAIASPPGGAARGIVRISGPDAINCLGPFFRPFDSRALSEAPSASAVAGWLELPGLDAPLPCDLYLWTAGATLPPGATTGRGFVSSYTGQPLVEVHTLGSPPLLELLWRSVCASGARPATAGEFTLRAFLAGRIDLSQAEAVLGVIEAADPRELSVALGQLAGGLSRPLQALRDALLDLLAHLEAGFDFADEDLPFITREQLDRRLAEAENRVAAILGQALSRGQPVDAVQAVLVGRPNTGKSSLLNALAGTQAALVSADPGTTRDYLMAELDLDRVKCRLVDVAGARGEGREEKGEGRGESGVEQAAESIAAAQRRQAHVQVLCLDATRPLDDWEREELARWPARARIIVLTKCDRPRRTDCDCAAIETSSVSGLGIEALRGELRRAALAAGGAQGDMVAATAARCCDSLRLAAECLGRARQLGAAAQEELAAAEIRAALEELGKVAGAVYTEDVLDRIFSRFCIGK